MLSDRTINLLREKGEISILTPDSLPSFFPGQIQTVSVDLRLGGLLEDGMHPRYEQTDLRAGTYYLKPGQFVLGSTVEVIKLSGNVVGMVHGKSTRARQGLIVHAAGLVDPGFNGQLTLEMYNMSGWGIPLEFGMLICQISFDWVDTTPERLYGDPELGSHYQGQYGPTPAVL